MTIVDPIGLLETMVGIPSVSGDEERMADTVHTWALEQGLRAARADRNVVIRIGGGNGKRLLLNSHLDTVAPVKSWQTDPFSPVREGDRIIGLGANDAKGCVAAMLSAAVKLNHSEVSGEVILALTVEEESGGTENGLMNLLPTLGDLDAAVIGEPTDLAVCVAQKGLLILEVETAGVARHAAHAHRIDGQNATVEAARAIMALADWKPGPEHHLLGPTTCQITTIQGGTKRNVIPDRCVFCLDIRTVPGVETEELIGDVRERTGAEVRVRSDRMKPFETDDGAQIVLAARRARPDARTIASATMSDAVWTRHLPTIKVGPGKTERSHTAGEYIKGDELLDGVAFYEQLMKEFFK
ncbi:MAG: M20 family metallo-hydrolase [Deltaproteobacteria bacterium]|nr:M20 family metallo-hydrolase [Deltaproteobacteria bacterium]